MVKQWLSSHAPAAVLCARLPRVKDGEVGVVCLLFQSGKGKPDESCS